MANEVITRLKVDNQGFDRKIKDAKKSIDQFGLSGTEAGQRIQELSRALSLNLGSISKFSMALTAGGTAIKVFGDALKKNELVVDEWGRTTKAASSLYDGFLNAINTGDISGYLANINSIVDAARKAYDAMDELGTFNAFNQINTIKAQAAFNDAVAKYRQGTMTKEDVQNAAANFKKELENRRRLEADTYETEISNLAKSRGVDAALLKEVLGGSWENYKAYKDLPLTGKKMDYVIDDPITGHGSWQEVAAPANKAEAIGQMLNRLNDTELDNLQKLGAQAAQTELQIANVNKQLARYTASAEKSTSIKPDKPAPTTVAEVVEDLGPTPEEILQRQIDIDNAEALRVMKQLYGLGDDMQAYLDANPLEIKVEIKEDAVELIDNTEHLASAWQYVAQSVSSVGSALSSIENPVTKVMAIIAQAVASVFAGMASAIAQKGKDMEPWSWIAFSASALATAVSTVSAIKSATAEYHADGGFAGGFKPRGTDTVPAMLTPGELILNAAQQRGLAASLQPSQTPTVLVQGDTRISGEDIRIAFNNYAMAVGNPKRL